MKKVCIKSFSIVTAMLVLFAQTQSLSAKPANVALPSIDESLLVLDESELDAAMQELDQLEDFLVENEDVTYNDLVATGSELIVHVDKASAPLGMNQEDDPPLGIPSFLWGCILGIVGILLVYILTDGDKDETKKALWGMLVWVGVWIILYVGVFSAASLWWY